VKVTILHQLPILRRLSIPPELQSQRDALSRLRKDNHKIRPDYDGLQLCHDDKSYKIGGWKKEKEPMENQNLGHYKGV
jgi:hypothetical protein